MYDNGFSIKYEGLTPDEKLENYLKFWLYEIQEYCPYDSYIEVRIIALTKLFLVELDVRYTYERFYGLGEDTTLESTLEAAEKSLYEQIKKWREIRFKSVSFNDSIDVLVVDDDPLSTKLIEACLSEQGCDVVTVASGEEALFSLKNKSYSFVVMDWNMRPLNGRKTLKLIDSNLNINKQPQRKKIPVLTYSSYSEDKISFPRTENLYQFAYLSKTSSFKRTFETTKKLVEHFNDLNNKYKFIS